MHSLTAAVPAGGSVDFAGSWSTFWSTVTSAVGGSGLTTLLTIIGVGFAVWALVQYLLEKRRGGGDTKGLTWKIVIAAACCAPTVVFPILLTIVDWAANIVINIWNKAG